jgi:PAS domain S-box-containing protein
MNNTSTSKRSNVTMKSGETKRKRKAPLMPDLYTRVIMSAPVPMAVYDHQGSPLFINEKMAALFGYESVAAFSEAIPNGSLLFSKDQRQQIKPYLRLLDETSRKKELVFSMRRRDGSEFFAEIEFSPLTDSSGNVDGYIGMFRDVTMQIRTENALRQSEQKYRNLAEAAPDFIFIIDRDDNVIYVNQHGAVHLRRPVNEIVGQKRSDLFPADISVHQKQALDIVFATGKPKYTENEISFFGSRGWLGTWLVPVYDENNEVRQVLGISRDLTTGKTAELTLRESEERFRDIVERSLDGYFFVEPNGRISNMNRALESILGYSKVDLEGMDYSVNVAEAYIAELRKLFASAMGGRPIFWSELELRHKSGRQVWVAFNARRVMLEGRVVGLEGFVKDISAYKRTLIALQKNQAQYRALFDNIPYEVFSLSLQGQVIEANRAFLSNWGPLLHKSFAESCTNPELRQFFETLIQKAVYRRSSVGGDFSKHIQNQERRYHTTLTPIITANGDLIGLVGMNMDITDQLHSVARMRDLSSRLLQVQEAERSHVSREIHDSLGQYLTALQLEIGTLTNALPHTDVSVRRLLDGAQGTINQAVTVARSLVKELHTPVLDDFGLIAALRDLVQEYERKWSIETTFVHRGIFSDISREIQTTLYRIVQEAMTNVLRHSRSKTVRLTLLQRERYLMLHFRDNGVGFDLTILPQLRKDHFGLYNIQERIELLGGRFRISSWIGKGTAIAAKVPFQEATNA